MAKSLAIIGIDPGELPWLRLVLFLLRHPDPLIPEMSKQTVLYLAKKAHQQGAREAEAEGDRRIKKGTEG